MNTHECNNNTADLSTNTTRKEIRLPRILKINSRFFFSFLFSFFSSIFRYWKIFAISEQSSPKITEVAHLHTLLVANTSSKQDRTLSFGLPWSSIVEIESLETLYLWFVLTFYSLKIYPRGQRICSFVNDEMILALGGISLWINVKYIPGGSEYCSKAVNLRYSSVISICSCHFQNDATLTFQ